MKLQTNIIIFKVIDSKQQLSFHDNPQNRCRKQNYERQNPSLSEQRVKTNIDINNQYNSNRTVRDPKIFHAIL